MITLSQQELKEIREKILPAIETLGITGRLKQSDFPDFEILQKIHLRIYGYKFDSGCPGCVADAIRLVGNVYRENLKLSASSATQESLEAPTIISEADLDPIQESQDPKSEGDPAPDQEDLSLGQRIVQGVSNIIQAVKGPKGGEEERNG